MNRTGDTMTGTLTIAQSNANNVAASFKGAANQNNDLTQWLNNNGTVLAKIDSSGNITTTNFSGTLTGTNTGDVTIGTANGLGLTGQQISLGLVDGTHNGALSSTDWNTFAAKVNRTGDTMTGQLKLNTPVTADSLAQILISTGSDGNKGLVVQGHSASQGGNLTEWQNSTGTVLSFVSSTGFLSLVADPTSSLQASTKQYVDLKTAGVVTSFNTRTGAVTLSNADVTAALGYVPLNKAGDTMTGAITVSGTANAVQETVKAFSSQANDLTQWTNSTGTVLSSIDSLGTYHGSASGLSGLVSSFNTRTGAVTLSTADITGALAYVPANRAGDTFTGATNITGTSDAVQQAIKGNSTQTHDLTQWQNSTGTVLAKVDSSGNFTATNISGTISGTNTGDVSIGTANGLGITGQQISLGLVDGTHNGALSSTDWNTFAAKVNRSGDTMTGQLKLNTPVTADSAAQILISTGADNQKGLVVQGHSSSQGSNLTEWQNSTGTVFSFVSSTGYLSLVADPTSALQAATKQYVDSKTAGVVTSFNTRTGAVTLSNADITGALAYVPLNKAGDTMTGAITVSGTANAIQETVKAFSSQASDLTQWANSTGTVLASVSSLGKFTGDGSGLSNVTGTDSTKLAKAGDTMTGAITVSGTANAVQAVIKAYSGQASDLTDWTNSTGTVLAYMSSLGKLTGDGSGLSNVTGTDSTKLAKAGDTMTGALTITGSADVTQIVVKANSTQSGAIQQWQNSTGTVLSGVGAGGNIGIGKGASPSAKLGVIANTGTDIVAQFQGTTSQTGDLTEWQNSTGTVLASINSLGKFTGDGSGLSNVTGTDSTKLAKAGDTMTGAITVSGTANVVQSVIKAYSGQGSDLTDWTNSTGTVLAYMSSLGKLTGDGSGLSNITSTDSTKLAKAGDTMTGALTVSGTNANANQLIVKGATNQAQDLTQWQNNTGTVLVTIMSNGYIGVGVTPPIRSLHVYSPNINEVALFESSNNGNISIQTDNNSTASVFLYGTNWGTRSEIDYDIASTSLSFTTNGTTKRMSIDANGNVGIGTTSLGALLDIHGISTQAEDLTDWRNGTGTILASVSSTGKFSGDGSGLSNVTGTDSTKVAKAGDTMTGALTVSGTANAVQSVIKAYSGQASDLTDWTNSTGTVLAYMSSLGKLTGDGSGLSNVTGTDSSKLAKAGDTMTGAFTISGTASVVQETVKAYSGQGSDLTDWTNSTGTVLASVNSSGTFSSTNTVTANGIGTSGLSNRLQLQIKGNSAQTSDLAEWQNSLGTILGKISSTGILTGDGSGLSNVTGTDSSKVAKAGDTMTGAITVSGTANAVQAVIKAYSGQASDLTDWTNSTGTVLAYMSSLGKLTGDGSGLSNITGTDSSNVAKAGDTMTGALTISGTNASANQLIVKGATNQAQDLMQWQNSTGTILITVTSAGRIGMGTTSPTWGNLQVDASDTNATIELANTSTGGTDRYPQMDIYNYMGSTTFSGNPLLYLENVRGTRSSPLLVKNGDSLGAVTFNGYDGSGDGEGARITAATTQDWTSSAHGGQLIFSTKANGATGNASTRVVIDQNGNTGIGTNTSGINALLHVKGSADQVQEIIQGNGTQTHDLTEWQNSTGTVLAYMSSLGKLTGDGSGLSNVTGTDSTKLAKAGDTMTGAITVSGTANVVQSVIKAYSGQASDLTD